MVHSKRSVHAVLKGVVPNVPLYINLMYGINIYIIFQYCLYTALLRPFFMSGIAVCFLVKKLYKEEFTVKWYIGYKEYKLIFLFILYNVIYTKKMTAFMQSFSIIFFLVFLCNSLSAADDTFFQCLCL